MNGIMQAKIALTPHTFTNKLLGEEIFGYDVHIKDDTATLADYLSALADFAAAYLADCYGCDSCCHERAPLIATDIELLQELLPPSQYPAHNVVKAFGELNINSDGAADITLKRDKNGCCFLDSAAKACREHHKRPFVCRSYYCLSKSARAEALRNAITNAGEDELVRLLWQEEANGAAPLLNDKINIKDYPAGGFAKKSRAAEVALKMVLPEALWRDLRSAES